MLKYTVILRAYNAGEKIIRSIEGVLNQVYQNWELIIVNDGSTDNTKIIAEDFASKDIRIKVLNQKNMGCVMATQNGIAASSGDYIVILDADDWYDSNYLYKVNEILNEYRYDIVVVNYNIINPDNKISHFKYFEKNCETDEKEAIKLILKTTNHAQWNKIVKREKYSFSDEEKKILINNGIPLNMGDDVYQIFPTLCKCSKVFFLSDCLYNYIIDESSISHSNVSDHWKELFIRLNYMEATYNTLVNYGYLTDEIKECLYRNTMSLIINSIYSVIKNFKIDKESIKKLRNNKYYSECVSNISYKNILNKYGKKVLISYIVFNKVLLHI